MKDIRTQWKALAAERNITREDIAALCIYRAMYKEEIPTGAKSRLHKSFKPITNPVKLANGTAPYGALEAAVSWIRYSAFSKWLDKDEMDALIEAAKATKAAGLK